MRLYRAVGKSASRRQITLLASLAVIALFAAACGPPRSVNPDTSASKPPVPLIGKSAEGMAVGATPSSLTATAKDDEVQRRHHERHETDHRRTDTDQRDLDILSITETHRDASGSPLQGGDTVTFVVKAVNEGPMSTFGFAVTDDSVQHNLVPDLGPTGRGAVCDNGTGSGPSPDGMSCEYTNQPIHQVTTTTFDVGIKGLTLNPSPQNLRNRICITDIGSPPLDEPECRTVIIPGVISD